MANHWTQMAEEFDALFEAWRFEPLPDHWTLREASQWASTAESRELARLQTQIRHWAQTGQWPPMTTDQARLMRLRLGHAVGVARFLSCQAPVFRPQTDLRLWLLEAAWDALGAERTRRTLVDLLAP